MKGRTFLAGFMGVLVLCYLLLMPPYLMKALQVDPYESWLQTEKEPYSGVITVLHVVGFKPYKGSLSSWLGERVRKLEQKHNGVFFEVLALSWDEAEAYLARGGRADVYSFPAGWAYAEQLQTLAVSAPFCRAGFRDVGRSGGLLAVPYAASMECVLVNDALLKERGVSVPEGEVSEAWLGEAGEQLAFEKKGKQYFAFAGDAITAVRLGACGKLAEYESFLSGRAAVAFCDLRAAGDLARSVAEGKGFPFSAYPAADSTALVQLIGIAKNMAAEKLLYAEELIQTVLGEDAQASLQELGLFPTVELAQMPQYEEELLAACAKLLPQMTVPNTFLLHGARDALLISAQRALIGDEDGKREFAERWKELVYGTKIK